MEEVLPFGATHTSPAGFYDEEEIQLRTFNSAMNMSEVATDKKRFVRLAKEDAANRAIEENLEKCRRAAAQQGRQMGRSYVNPSVSPEVREAVTAQMAAAYSTPGYFDPQ